MLICVPNVKSWLTKDLAVLNSDMQRRNLFLENVESTTCTLEKLDKIIFQNVRTRRKVFVCLITDGSNVKEVQFSAVVPKKFIKGEYSMIDISMYEEPSVIWIWAQHAQCFELSEQNKAMH